VLSHFPLSQPFYFFGKAWNLRLYYFVKLKVTVQVIRWEEDIDALHLWEKAKEMAKSVCKEEDGVGIEMWTLRRIKL